MGNGIYFGLDDVAQLAVNPPYVYAFGNLLTLSCAVVSVRIEGVVVVANVSLLVELSISSILIHACDGLGLDGYY